MGCNNSPDVLKGISKSIRGPMEGFSATELLDCPRSVWLKRRHSYGCKPAKLYWAFRGTIAHKIMEDYKSDGDISEQRFFAELGGFRVSGQPDLIRGDVIYDWKTTSRLPDKPLDHHVKQLSFYRVLLAKQEPAIKITKGVIVYIDMMKHAMYETALLPLVEAEREMAERLNTLNSETEPSFEEHFSTSNWKCGRTAETSYCEVRGVCTQGQKMPVFTTKRRTVREAGR